MMYSCHVCRTVWLVVACAMTAGVCACTALAAVPAGLVTATLGDTLASHALTGITAHRLGSHLPRLLRSR